MEHIDFSVLSTGQLIDKLDGILIQLTQNSPKRAYCDSNTNTLRWVEDTYLLLTAQRLAEEINHKTIQIGTLIEEKGKNNIHSALCDFPLIWAAKISHALNLVWELHSNYPYKNIPTPNEIQPFFTWLKQYIPDDSTLTVDIGVLLTELFNTLNECDGYTTTIISSNYRAYYYLNCILEVLKAQRDYNEAKDRCKPSEWEDKKHQLKNENLDKLKANHFGKHFIDYADNPDLRFHYALVETFQDAASQYIEDDRETDISEKIHEFYYLQALYCLLHDEAPLPPEFREPEELSQPEIETPQADSTAQKKEPNNYTLEERQKIIDCYTGLAGFMGIDTHWITVIFKPNDDNLWAAIKADRQIPLMHPNRNDGTNIAPLLNLLGVLCHTKKLSNKPSSYYNKLSKQLTHLDKNRIASLVKNGNREDLRGLANTIKECLDKLTEQ